MGRQFGIAPLGAIAAQLVGCSPGIVGEWRATHMSYGQKGVPLPVTYTDVNDGVTYTYTQGVRLKVEDDGDARIETYYDYTSSDGARESETYTYDGGWEAVGPRQFAITIVWDEKVDLDCTLDDDVLECDFEEQSIEFERLD